MALTVQDESYVPKSTGAVPGPAEVTEHIGTDDNTSTGAVEYQAPGETAVSYYGQPVVVNSPNPEPVTMTVSWLDEKPAKEAKVVEAPKAKPAKTSAAKVQTK